MIKMYEIPESTQIRLREAYLKAHEKGISDTIKYLRLEQYHLERMLMITDTIRYYNQFDLSEVIDQGDNNDLFEQTIELELKDLNNDYAEAELDRIKAHAVFEYLDSKEAEI